MSTKPKPSYFAIITANVRYDVSLPANAKLLFAEITSLSSQEGYCFASNRHFAELFDVSGDTISRWITALVDAGYLDREIERDPDTQQVLSRKLRIPGADPSRQNKGEVPALGKGTPPGGNADTPPGKKIKGINKEILNNKEKNISLVDKQAVEVFDFWKETFNLNGRTLLSPLRKSKILARIKQGYTVEEIKTAITACSQSDYHVQNGHTDIELICRDETKLDNFLKRAETQVAAKTVKPEDDPFWIDPEPPPDYPYITGWQKRQWTEEEYPDRERYEKSRDSWLLAFQKRGREKYELALQQVETYEQSLEFQRRFNLDGMHT